MSERGTVRLERVYASGPSAVWRALVTPELLAAWWAPGDIRAEVGHLFHLDMGPWGKQPCEVLEVLPEKKLVFSFAKGTLDTTLTFTLEAEGTGTRLVLEHAGFDLDSPLAKRAFEGMKSGWPGVLERLVPVLARPS
jgi:uncharacterized protein YndB with AHSA1/START domain